MSVAAVRRMGLHPNPSKYFRGWIPSLRNSRGIIMPAWLHQDWCLSFVLALGHFLWQGTLIALVLAIVLRAVKSVAARYWLSLTALLLMAACPVMTLFWLMQPVSPVAVLDTPPPIVGEEFSPSQPMIPPTSFADADKVEHVSKVPVIPPVAPIELNTTSTTPPQALADDRRWWQRFAPQLTTAYLGGVALMFLRLAIGLWGGRRLRRRAVPVTDDSLLGAMQRQATALGLKLLPVLAYCERVTVPTVVGVLKPMILLPVTLATGLSPEQIESVLAHELAHLRRYDHLVNLLQRVIESLLFFHPALWWVSHRIRDEREHCCDDLVVACGAMPLDYAKSLLRVAELSRASKLRRSVTAVSLLATGDNPSSLRQRISRLLGESTTPSLRISPRVLTVSITILVVGLAMLIQLGVSNDQTSKAVDDETVAINPPLEFRIAVTKVDRDQDGVAWFPIMGPRVPAPAGKSGADLPIKEKLDDEWRGLLWDKAEHALLADGTWKVVRCDVVKTEHSTDVAPRFDIQIKLDNAGAALMRRLTAAHLNQKLAIVVDGSITAAPVLRSEIGESCVITGDFSKPTAENLAAAIRRPDQRRTRIAEKTVRHAVKLPTGAAIELIGVGAHEAKTKDWWNANGIRLLRDPRDSRLCQVAFPTNAGPSQSDCREFAVQVSGLPKVYVGYGLIPLESHLAYQVCYESDDQVAREVIVTEPSVFTIGSLPAPFKAKAATLRIGMDELQEEEFVRSLDPDGKKQGDDPAFAETKRVEELIQPLRVRTLEDRTELTLKSVPRGRSDIIETAPIAIDKDNHRHNSVSAIRLADGQINYLYQVPQDRIAKFEYRLKRYRHWVTFENVSLQPGQQTDVKVKVESLRDEKPRLLSSPLIGLLPHGRKIELVGVAHAQVAGANGSRRKAEGWWLPSGVTLDKEPFSKLSPMSVPASKQQLREFAIRLETRPKELASPEQAKLTPMHGNVWFASLRGQQPTALSWDESGFMQYQVAMGFETEQPNAFAFYYSDDVVIEAGVLGLDGKIEPGTNATARTKSLLQLVDVVGIEKSATENIVTLRPSMHHWPMQIFLSAISPDGTRIQPANPDDRDRLVFKVPATETEGFQINLRPMTHRVLIENIALLPGQKTDPKLTVDSLDSLVKITLRKDGNTLGRVGEVPLPQLEETLKSFQEGLNSETGELIINAHSAASLEAAERIVEKFKTKGWKWPTIKVSQQSPFTATANGAETSPPVGLDFLKPYPKLHGLSLDMTEPQFLEIVKQHELKTRKTGDGEKVTHRISLGDGHTLIVMFDKDAKCGGIQRVRGEDEDRNQPNNANGDLRSNPAAGSGDPRRAQTAAASTREDPPGDRAVEKTQKRVAIQDVVRGVDFLRVKEVRFEEALRHTPELHVPDPKNPGTWDRPKNVFPMPLGEHTWLKYPAGSGHFYIEHRPDGSPDSELLYGPIEGDPFEVLKLDDFFREKLKFDSNIGSSDPVYRLRLMFRTAEPSLMQRAWQFIEPVLSRKFSNRNEPGFFERLAILEIARDGLREQVAANKSAELVDLGQRMRDVIGAAEASVDAINDSVPDASYQSATYLQPKIQAQLPDALWGKPVSGLRLGLVPRESGPDSEWDALPADASLPTTIKAKPGEPLHFLLMVENVSDAEIKFCAYVGGEEMARSVEILDHKGQAARVDSLPTDIPHFISHWRLKPRERMLLTIPAIHFRPVSPDSPTKGLGYHVTAANGRYSLRCSYHFGDLDTSRQRHIPGKTEWIGQLTTGTQTITVGAGKDDDATAPPDGLKFLKPYPKLHGLSLDMTEPQFLEIVKQQELKTRKIVEGEKVTHHIALGDGHTLIVMFDKDAKCSGIQRVRGEDDEAAAREDRLGDEKKPDNAVWKTIDSGPVAECRAIIKRLDEAGEVKLASGARERLAKRWKWIAEQPVASFLRELPKKVPNGEPNFDRGPLVGVQTELDGVWSNGKGTADNWKDWIVRKQKDYRIYRLQLLFEAAQGYRKAEDAASAKRVLQAGLSGHEIFDADLKTLIAKYWPVTDEESKTSLGPAPIAWTLANYLGELSAAQQKLGEIDQAIITHSRLLLAHFLLSWGQPSDGPNKHSRELWSLIRQRPESLPPLFWFNVIDEKNPQHKFDLSSVGPR